MEIVLDDGFCDFVGEKDRPPLVCTENPIRIDRGRESPNVSAHDRAAVFCLGRVGLAIQVEEPAIPSAREDQPQQK